MARPLRTLSPWQSQQTSSTSLLEYQIIPVPPVAPDGMNLNGSMVSNTGPRPDPMRISSIVSPAAGDGSRTTTDTGSCDLPSVEYSLLVRQQPVAARSCGLGERDRRVIDPPPIIQLTIRDPNSTQDENEKQLHGNHYVMICSLYDENGSRDVTFMTGQQRQERQLLGTWVTTPFIGEDEYGKEGCFFCFPDLSCRAPGRFRLGFSLTEINPTHAEEVRHFPVLLEGKSNVFTVYTPKDFPGMEASTKLVKCLKEQGCIIPVRKGTARPKNASGDNHLHDQEQDEANSSS